MAEVAGSDAAPGETQEANGTWIMLTVRDTGVGMDAETQSRVFEPFFTTKGLGEGAGLGLASVYGVVQQSGGHIAVESAPGLGTTFRVYLPRSGDIPRQTPLSPVAAAVASPASETILLVDDDDSVRLLYGKVLRRQGYTVLEARHATEALVIIERHPAAIQLLITDILMPQMNGLELAQLAIPMRQDMQVLFVSGYSAQVALPADMIADETHFLQKPFTPATLIERVKVMLERGVRSGSATSQRTDPASAFEREPIRNRLSERPLRPTGTSKDPRTDPHRLSATGCEPGVEKQLPTESSPLVKEFAPGSVPSPH